MSFPIIVSSPASSCNKLDALRIIIRGPILRSLPFREHDQGGPVDVELRVHAACTLHAAGQRQTHVGAVPHTVARERLKGERG